MISGIFVIIEIFFLVYTNNDITSSLHTYLFLRSIPERCILEALLRGVLYCGHSTQYSHLVEFDLYAASFFSVILQKWHLCEAGYTFCIYRIGDLNEKLIDISEKKFIRDTFIKL